MKSDTKLKQKLEKKIERIIPQGIANRLSFLKSALDSKWFIPERVLALAKEVGFDSIDGLKYSDLEQALGAPPTQNLVRISFLLGLPLNDEMIDQEAIIKLIESKPKLKLDYSTLVKEGGRVADVLKVICAPEKPQFDEDLKKDILIAIRENKPQLADYRDSVLLRSKLIDLGYGIEKLNSQGFNLTRRSKLKTLLSQVEKKIKEERKKQLSSFLS